jgi:hypothetical protein
LQLNEPLPTVRVEGPQDRCGPPAEHDVHDRGDRTGKFGLGRRERRPDHDDRLAFWCAAPPGAQQALVTEDPRRFFVPSYVGGRGWIGVRLDVPTDWDVVAELSEDAYRTVAPRRLVAGLDTCDSGSAPDREIG